MKLNPRRLGVDIGRVITDPKGEQSEEARFGGGHLEVPEMEHAFDSLRFLMETNFCQCIYLVSCCKRRTADATRSWLIAHDFFKRTGIPESNVFYCIERREKADICRALGITHFVDDRLEVHIHLKDIVPGRFLFRPDSKEVERFSHELPSVQRVESWLELLSILFERD